MADEHPVPSPARRLPVEPCPREGALEDYLDHLCAPLVGVVPYERRAELRREWRAHLEALEEAHAELGASEGEALVAAFRQFGDPRRVGREWALEYRVGEARLLSAVKRAGVGAALLGSAGLGISAHTATLETMTYPMVTALAGGPGIPLVAGFLIGLLPERHPLGSWKGLLATALGAALLSASLPPPLFTPETPAPAGWFAAIQVCVWMMVACGSAGFSRVCKVWNERRQLWLSSR